MAGFFTLHPGGRVSNQPVQLIIACGQIDIGKAATDMTARMRSGAAQADGSMRVEPTFDVAHVASTVVYMSNLALDANVRFVTVMRIDVPYIGQG